MKAAKFFALLFALVAVVLMVGTAFLSFTSLNNPVRILENPTNALRSTEQLQQYLNEGDLTSAGSLLYGHPDLGTEGTVEDPGTALLWEAFRDSFTLTYTSNLYLLDGELARDGVLTVLDLPALMEEIQENTQALLAQAGEDAYNEEGTLLPEAAEKILEEAVRQALESEPACVSRNVVIRAIRRDDRWWILPDQAFLKALTGLNA